MKIDKEAASTKRGGRLVWMEKSGAVLFALLVWQLAAMLLHTDILLVTPLQVFTRLLTIWKTEGFLISIAFTCSHIAAGFLAGLFFGLLFAAAAAKWSFAGILLRPWIAVMRSVPAASFTVICLIWLHPENLSVFIACLITLPIVCENVEKGLKETDYRLKETAELFRLSFVRRIRFLYLPAVKPYFLSACSVAAGMVWKAGIAAELIGAPSGSVGKQLYLAKIYLDTDDLLAWTVIIVILSVCFEKAVGKGLQCILDRLGSVYPVHKSGKKRYPLGDKFTLFENTVDSWDKNEDLTKESVDPSDKNEDLTKGTVDPSDKNMDIAEAKILSADSDSNLNPSSSSNPVSAAGWLQLCGLSKSYEEKEVFQNIQYSFQKGRSYAVMGPSGCGKTTLFRILAGLEEADQGQIEGCPRQIAFVFQEDRLFEALSAAENAAIVMKGSFEKNRKTILKHLELVGLKGFEDMPCSALSGGMKRRAALVRALLADAELLLLDEPFNGLDQATVQLVKSYLTEEWRQSKNMKTGKNSTLLMITHHKEDTEGLQECSVLNWEELKQNENRK